MKHLSLLFITLLSSQTILADENIITTRFGQLMIKETQGPKQEVIKDNKSLFKIDAISVQTEQKFNLKNKDIVLLRFHQNANSREDTLLFVSIDTTGASNVSTTFSYPANVPIMATIENEQILIDSGYDRYTHLFTVYQEGQISTLKKAAKADEVQEEPLADNDCNKIYNQIYVHSFTAEQCKNITTDIKAAFNTLTYRVMAERSHLLNVKELMSLSTSACEQKSLLMYNDFKNQICGYATSKNTSNATTASTR